MTTVLVELKLVHIRPRHIGIDATHGLVGHNILSESSLIHMAIHPLFQCLSFMCVCCSHILMISDNSCNATAYVAYALLGPITLSMGFY